MNKIYITLLLQMLLALSIVLFAAPVLAQTCPGAIIPTAPDNRYQDNADGTVTDLYTGLMWQQCSIGQSGSGCTSGTATDFTWNLALQQGDTLNSGGGFAGYTDWRLPNVKELESLTEDACYSPVINVTLFPNTVNLNYWSSSPYANLSNYAWYVNFGYGNSSLIYRSNGYYVRLVRSGQ